MVCTWAVPWLFLLPGTQPEFNWDAPQTVDCQAPPTTGLPALAAPSHSPLAPSQMPGFPTFPADRRPSACGYRHRLPARRAISLRRSAAVAWWTLIRPLSGRGRLTECVPETRLLGYRGSTLETRRLNLRAFPETCPQWSAALVSWRV